MKENTAKENGSCPYKGSCRCSCGPCKARGAKRWDHCGQHGNDCHLDC
jgi:hypothetical protein